MPASSTAIVEGSRRTCRASPESFSGSSFSGTAWSRCSDIRRRARAARMSYEGILELIAVPAGLLIMLGLFTRQMGLVLAVMYLTLFFVGPLQRGPFTHRNGGDPVLLNAFLLLYLAAVRRRRLERRPVATVERRGR